ncbi:MAG: energy transducer TonB [Zoogloeaceae bacterium]|nr:energy transducer TonB [Zoogloeaceae bacterium]
MSWHAPVSPVAGLGVDVTSTPDVSGQESTLARPRHPRIPAAPALPMSAAPQMPPRDHAPVVTAVTPAAASVPASMTAETGGMAANASDVVSAVADALPERVALSGDMESYGGGSGGVLAGTENAHIPADALWDYRYALGRSVLGVSGHYQERANAAGQAGTVRVKLEWRMGVSYISLRQGSGSPRLDAMALNILREAAARTPLPQSLRQRTFSMELPVEFRVN